jgi:hypothetical protein
VRPKAPGGVGGDAAGVAAEWLRRPRLNSAWPFRLRSYPMIAPRHRIRVRPSRRAASARSTRAPRPRHPASYHLNSGPAPTLFDRPQRGQLFPISPPTLAPARNRGKRGRSVPAAAG